MLRAGESQRRGTGTPVYAILTAIDPPEEDDLFLPNPNVLDTLIRALARDAADAHCDRVWGRA